MSMTKAGKEIDLAVQEGSQLPQLPSILYSIECGELLIKALIDSDSKVKAM